MTMKYHNICHYGKMVEMFPNTHLSAFSTLRFESANSRIKRLLNVGNSYLNPCKTIIQKVLWSNFLNSCVLKNKNEPDETIDISWEYRLPEFNADQFDSSSKNLSLHIEFNELNNTLTSLISED
uniref:Dimer_Tnp_hAT domain-containing protein n=1 Tax=Strongyloides venezuelensis TaxID=75913 RepID=A0A0K0FI77_STRVS